MDARSQELLQVAGLNKRYGEDEVLAAVAFSVRAVEPPPSSYTSTPVRI